MAGDPSPDDLQALGDLVRKTREGRRQAVEAVAEAVRVSPVTWRRVETGKVVKPMTYAAVDQAMGWASGSAVEYLRSRTEPDVVAPSASGGGATPSLVSRVEEVYHSNLSDAMKLDIILDWVRKAAATQPAEETEPSENTDGVDKPSTDGTRSA